MPDQKPNSKPESAEQPSDEGLSSSVLLGVVDDTYGTICDLLSAIREQAIDGYCCRIGQMGALYRIAARLRANGVEHEVLTLLEIQQALPPEKIEIQGSALLYAIFCIGLREGWINSSPNS